MKQHLVTVPGTYRPLIDRNEYIYITLRNKNGVKTYSVNKDKKVSISTIFYSYITPEGQTVIRRHFEKEFKAAFRNYMKGALNNNPDMKINDAIEEFLNDHKVTMNHISMSMLQKDWYRYKIRCMTSNVCPLCF